MDIFLAVLGGILLVAGLIGAFLPVLPGPPLAWLGILSLHFTSYVAFSTTFLVTTAVVMLVVTLLDYYVPIWGTKKLGGTKKGIIGSTVGLLVGLFFFPPLGIIVGPFIGAFAGEMIANPNDVNTALKSAIGSLIGFLVGTGLKFVYAVVLIYYFVAALV